MRRYFSFFYRQMLESLSYKSGFIFESSSAIFQILIFFFIAKLIPAENAAGFLGNQAGYFPFVLAGIAFSFYQSSALHSFTGALSSERENGTLEIVLMNTPILTLLGAALFWNIFWTTLRIIFYFAAGLFLFPFALPSVDLFALLLCVLLTVSSLAGLGLFSAGYALVHKKGDPLSFFLNGISRFFGGVFFPASVLPAWGQTISSLLPLSHSLTAFRSVLLDGLPLAEIFQPLLVLTVFTFLLLPAGIFYFRASYRRALREGSLNFR